MAGGLQHPHCTLVNFDQCQLGPKNSHGDPGKKPTQLVPSDGDLVYDFKDLKCGRCPSRCNGTHAPLTGREVYAARLWPWDFANRLAWGVVRLMKRNTGSSDGIAATCITQRVLPTKFNALLAARTGLVIAANTPVSEVDAGFLTTKALCMDARHAYVIDHITTKITLAMGRSSHVPSALSEGTSCRCVKDAGTSS